VTRIAPAVGPLLVPVTVWAMTFGSCRAVGGHDPGRSPDRLPKPAPHLRLTIRTDPSSFPERLRVGQHIVVKVDAILPNGTRCYACSVTGSVTPSGLGAWSGFSEIDGVHVGTLTPQRSGPADMTIDICPGGPYVCERLEYRRRVEP